MVFVTDKVDLFGSLSQGFAPSEVGRVLRQQAGSGGAVERIDSEAPTVDDYEVGLRGDWSMLEKSVVGFYSESDLGTNFTRNLQVTRQEERIWGVESNVKLDLTGQWTLGGTTPWVASATDEDGDGDLDEELPNTRVPPIKLTGFGEYAPFEWWSNRLQVLDSGDRSPDSTIFGSAPVESFTGWLTTRPSASVPAISASAWRTCSTRTTSPLRPKRSGWTRPSPRDRAAP